MDRRHFLATGLALPAALRGVAGAPSSAPSVQPDPFGDLANRVASLMAEHRIPGAALGVIKDGTVRTRAFGVTSVEDPRPVTPDTVFELASLSKTVTATAVMTLVEQGRLDLDAPVRRYLPDFGVQDPLTSADVTVRHLLTHAPGWEARYDVGEGPDALARWVPTMRDLEQIAPPGRVWSYNNPGYGLAGRLVEVVSGMEFRDALDTLVFGPVGLERASTRLEEIVTWPVALGHRPGPQGEPQVVRPYSMGSSIPAGGVNMSLDSLMTYLAFHLGEHDGAGPGALGRRGREEMRVPHIRKEPTTEQMGLGFHLRTLGGVLTAAHGGTAGAGHRSHMQLVPDRRLAFAILTNHTEGWRLLQAVEHAALSAYEGLSLAPNQAICGYRGHTETLDHVTPLARQPAPDAYVGSYRIGRGRWREVRAAPDGGLLVGDPAAPVLFYGEDVAFHTRGDRINCDFIRDESGEVRWVRVGGQVGRRED